ncbi:MAG: EFR1 family ferrodoxin [Deferribacterales bacterium]
MKTYIINFSPTGTTKAVLESIAEGIGNETITYDLTLPDSSVQANITDGIALFGIPVYAGRVPLVCAERMKNITSDGAPAVAVAVYGNRAYEDALVELRDLISAAGFNVIAGGAFIGEHSYSSAEKPVAQGRPDSADRQKANDFGSMVSDKVKSGRTQTPDMNGNVPYKERMGIKGVTPQTKTDICGACGTCVSVCPTDAITIETTASSDADKCVMCCACIKQCPSDARYIAHPGILERIDMLYKNCSARKEPELFI